MQIFMDITPHSTKRLSFFNLANLSQRDESGFELVSTMLTRVCCWGGADKMERAENGRLDLLSFELPPDIADSVWVVTKRMLEQAGIQFAEGFPH